MKEGSKVLSLRFTLLILGKLCCLIVFSIFARHCTNWIHSSTLLLLFFWVDNCSLCRVFRSGSFFSRTTFPPAITLLSWQMSVDVRLENVVFDSFHCFWRWWLPATIYQYHHQNRSSESNWKHVNAYFISADCFQHGFFLLLYWLLYFFDRLKRRKRRLFCCCFYLLSLNYLLWLSLLSYFFLLIVCSFTVACSGRLSSEN